MGLSETREVKVHNFTYIDCDIINSEISSLNLSLSNDSPTGIASDTFIIILIESLKPKCHYIPVRKIFGNPGCQTKLNTSLLALQF